MSGVRLDELSAPDFVDVLHYMYETDLHASSAEAQEAKDKSRIMLYERLYERDYPYASTANSQGLYDTIGPPLDDDEFDVPPTPLDPKARTRRAAKAYTPPTTFNPDLVNPYQGVLDAPLG